MSLQPHGRDMVEEARLEHHVEHGIAHGHGERVAAEGRAMAAGGHAGARGLGGEAGADGEAAAEPFGGRHDVRGDARPFMGE